MDNLIVISYKSDHTDTVKGCVMDRFNSEFEINTGPEDEVLAKLVKLDMGLDVHDTSYEHYFIIGGFVVGGYDEIYSPYARTGNVKNDIFIIKELEKSVRIRYKMLDDKYKNMLKMAKSKLKEEKEIQKMVQQHIDNKQKRLVEIQKLQELKEKYPDQ